ncbi:MAG: L-aspartate oxidase [Bacillota bacterium]
MIPRYLVNLQADNLKKLKTDYLVIGSGIAGATAALELAGTGEVTVLSKGEFEETNTKYAQGGIATAWAQDDDADLHYQDTITAGAGLCNSRAVEVLVSESQQLIKKLIDWGVKFDQEEDGLALTKEGAHSKSRILRARGDATGAEISSALGEKLKSNPHIKSRDNSFMLDLLTADNCCYGIYAYDQEEDEYFIYQAKAVILATGGSGELYYVTSNPSYATGDGLAAAYRAGVEVMDLEMVQFHPTVLSLEQEDDFLISEAVRGEGAKLRRADGSRFMFKYHRLAELAPRDIVARAIEEEISEQEENHVYLDVTDLKEDFLRKRFPNIYQKCLELNIDISTDYIPVTPAAHYFMGGIKTDINGQTSLDRLFACGETACLGVHGANRLASNSLLEGLVYGYRAAQEIKDKNYQAQLEIEQEQIEDTIESDLNLAEVKEELQKLMQEKAAIVREEDSLQEMLDYLEEKLELLKIDYTTVEAWEVQNMLIVAYLMTKSALLREESRGAHYRKDYPEPKIEWEKHIVLERGQEWRTEKLEFNKE